MTKGHVTGYKRERTGHGTDWFRQLEEERIQQVEQAQHAQEPTKDDA